MMDAYLLRIFPGRTLDEIDGMDWPRYLRAMEVNRVMAIEERRSQFLEGKIDPGALTPDEWDAIQEHDDLMEQHTTRIDV